MSLLLPRICCALFSVLLFGCVHTKPTTPETRNLVYANRDGRAVKLDLYLPPIPPPKGGYPLIVCFHGGGWIINGKNNEVFLRPLVDQGYALASVEYRLSNNAKFPAQIEDARDGLRWLIKNASRYHLDTDRIGAFGPSAGGHLALLLGFAETERFGASPSFPRGTIKAICALYPPTDLVGIIPEDKRGKSTNLVALLLGGSIHEKQALAVKGSPMTYVSRNSPPTLLIHGDMDAIVPLEQSEQLNTLMHRKGASSYLIIRQGKTHAFALETRILEKVKRFYDKNL